MPLYTIYRVTHPEEPGCYVGYSTKTANIAYCCLKNRCRTVNNRMAQILHKHDMKGFVVETLGLVNLTKDQMNDYIVVCTKHYSATWNSIGVFTCDACNRTFKRESGFESHLKACVVRKSRAAFVPIAAILEIK